LGPRRAAEHRFVNSIQAGSDIDAALSNPASAFARNAKIVFVDAGVAIRSMTDAALRYGGFAIVILAAGGTCEFLMFDRDNFHYTTSSALKPFDPASLQGSGNTRRSASPPFLPHEAFDSNGFSKWLSRLYSVNEHGYKVMASHSLSSLKQPKDRFGPGNGGGDKKRRAVFRARRALRMRIVR
jgi:hypothetical protein